MAQGEYRVEVSGGNGVHCFAAAVGYTTLAPNLPVIHYTICLTAPAKIQADAGLQPPVAVIEIYEQLVLDRRCGYVAGICKEVTCIGDAGQKIPVLRIVIAGRQIPFEPGMLFSVEQVVSTERGGETGFMIISYRGREKILHHNGALEIGCFCPIGRIVTVANSDEDLTLFLLL